MGKYVDRNFVLSLVDFYYGERKNHYFYCNCLKCQRYKNLLNEMKKWSFETFNIHHNKWFFIFNSHNPNIVSFPVFIWKKMPKQIKIKYFKESVFAKEPVKATEGSAGYDLFAAEVKTIVPNSSQMFVLI